MSQTDTATHRLTETESYFGFLRSGPRTEPVPAESEAVSDHGMGSIWRQHCACGWASSWSRNRTAAMNGGKAHIRAESRKGG